MLTLLLPLAFALSLPPTQHSSRFQRDVDLRITPAVAHWQDDFITTTERTELGGSAQLQMTVFAPARPRRRCAAVAGVLAARDPLRLAISGDAFYAYDYSGGLASNDRLNAAGPGVRIAADGYIARHLYVAGSFGYALDHSWNDQVGSANVEELLFAAAAGVRFGDVRIAATWSTSPSATATAGTSAIGRTSDCACTRSSGATSSSTAAASCYKTAVAGT